jgi:hypothetical protein
MYDPPARRFARAMAGQFAMAQLPRYLIEVVGLGSVLFVVAYLILSINVYLESMAFGRFRLAYGESGQEPDLYQLQNEFHSTLINDFNPGSRLLPSLGGFGGAYTAATLGNPNLRPERVREIVRLGATVVLNAGEQSPTPALHDAPSDMELHRDEVLRLVLHPDEPLPQLQAQPLQRVHDPEEDDHPGRAREVHPCHQLYDQRDRGAYQHAPEVLRPGEPLVDRVLVHPPGGDVGACDCADGECDHEFQRTDLHW